MSDGIALVLMMALTGGSFALAVTARRVRAFRIERLVVGSDPSSLSVERPAFRRRFPRVMRMGARVAGSAAGLIGGWMILGPVGGAGGAFVGFLAPLALERRRRGRQSDGLEKQLAEAIEAVSIAVRSGLSVVQALEFSAGEVGEPLRGRIGRMLAAHRVGVPLEEAVQQFADEIATNDARLFGLILIIHLRSGGNLSSALSQVVSTVRHRVAARRELRALTAQGRISGTVLGSLPIVFLLVLALTSRDELGPVYRSTAGMAMVVGGLVLEAIAYVWIRSILRVEDA